MDLLGVDVEGGPGQDLGPVEGVAVGRRPETRLLAAGGEVLAPEAFEEGGVGRDDHLPDEPLDPLPVGLRGDPGAGHDDRLPGGDLEDALQLLDGPGRHDPRRGQPRGHAVHQQLAVRRHEAVVGTETRLEALESLGRVGRLEHRDLGEERLRAGHLVDDPEQVGPLVLLDDPELAHHPDHVEGDPVLERLLGGIDRGGLGEGRDHERPTAGPTLRARILEPVVVALVAVHRGRRRVVLEDRLPEPIGEAIDRRVGVELGHRGVSCCTGGRPTAAEGSRKDRVTGASVRRRAGGRERRASAEPAQPPKRGICSPPRCSTGGSRPMNGSRSPRLSVSRVAKAWRWFVLRMCQLPSSRAARRRGDRSSL